MFFYKEPFKLIFNYIFFLSFTIIFIQFSTAALSDEVYKVEKIEISEKFEQDFNKNKIINKAFGIAFNELISKITLSTDRDKLNKIKSSDIKNLVDYFAVTDEKFINNLYVANFEVEFNKKNVIGLLEKNNIFPSIPKKKDMLILPVYIKNNQYNAALYSENNFYLQWNENNEKHSLISYILPNEDIEDIRLIIENIDEVENYNFEKIIEKYNLNDFIIVVFYENEIELNVLSKVYFNKSHKILNNKFNNFNIDNLNLVNNVIKKLKNTYEDEWKKLNQINSSINLTLTLALDSKNHKLINSFEKKLSNLDLVAKYSIYKFSNERVIYKIVYNNSPNKFIEEITSSGFNIDNSSAIWKIK
tara:strand:- start:557 stop:1636 length:1080 start_codon:yes stop_codon:yes gene_type:complete